MSSQMKRRPYPSTGTFILDYLRAVGEDYPYNVWKELRAQLRAEGQRAPILSSFYSYWHVCEQMDLIRFTREEPGERLGPRKFFELVPENTDSKDWRNPRAALDMRLGRTVPDPHTGKPVPVSRLGRRRYRRRVLKVPPLRRGRPSKPKKQRVAEGLQTRT